MKDEMDDFDFLMNESFERKKKDKRKINHDEGNLLAVGEDLSTILGSTQIQASERQNNNPQRHRVIEEPHQITEYDVDDLIKELTGEESWRKRQ